MKRSNILKKSLLLLILSFALIFSMACGNDSSKDDAKVTNLESEEVLEDEADLKDLKDEKEELDSEKNEKDLEKKEKEEEDKKKDSKQEETEKDEKDKKEINKKEEKDKNDEVVIDGVTYKGYKGPVQGEIKYKEGRPADQDSLTRKASGDIGSPYKIDLIVTQDFGHQKMFAKSVGLVKDEVGMEVLFRNLDIQTAYGGGFVNAINGIESQFTFFAGSDRKKIDWFYYVNGILAPIGVAEYRPQAGDSIWWDYHDWSMTMFIPAVVGSYPQPFKGGFGGNNPGTAILYTEEYSEKAQELKQSLHNKGVKQVDIAEYNPNLIEKPNKYYIIIGTWDNLSANSNLLQDVNTRNKFLGTYVKFENDKIQGLDFKGKVKVEKDSSTGAIYASAGGIGSTKPVWVVTGIDDEGVGLALDTLIRNPQALDKKFGAFIENGKVSNVPFK